MKLRNQNNTGNRLEEGANFCLLQRGQGHDRVNGRYSSTGRGLPAAGGFDGRERPEYNLTYASRAAEAVQFVNSMAVLERTCRPPELSSNEPETERGQLGSSHASPWPGVTNPGLRT